VTLGAGGPFISDQGTTVAAVDTGDQYTVYPKGGGTSWEVPAIALVIRNYQPAGCQTVHDVQRDVSAMSLHDLAPRAGLEPAAYCLGGSRSIRLSYRGRNHPACSPLERPPPGANQA
jgi:hypothetical protein